MLDKTDIQKHPLPTSLRAGMEAMGYMMYAAQRVSSPDKLWDVFDTFISQGPVSHWLYYPFAPYENQLSAHSHQAAAGPFSPANTQNTLCVNANQFVKETLRGIEIPMSLSETTPFTKLSEKNQNTLAEGLGTSNFDLVQLIPVFGAKGYNGGFVIIPNKEALDKRMDKSDHEETCGDRRAHLSMACQVIHQLYIDRFAEKLKLPAPLTPRERDILEGLSRGLSNADIAAAYGLSSHTVNGYLRRIFLKTDAPNRTTAVLKGFATGLIS